MRYFLAVMMMVFVSCGGGESDVPPAGILVADSMASVLAEIHLLEAAISIRVPTSVHPMNLPGMPNLPQDPSFTDVKQENIDSIGYYNIFSTFHITRQQYDSSMKWYCTHPAALSSLYEKVETELTKREMKETSGK